jgi:hypothetical protein
MIFIRKPQHRGNIEVWRHMRRARNAVVVLILCIIGGYSLMKKAGPTLNMPAAPEEMRDAMSGNPTRASRPGLNFGQTTDGELRDAVANNAAETGGNGAPFGNTDGGVGAPPRGSGNGGFGPAGTNAGNNFPPQNPPENLSPSSPESEEQPICPQRSSEGCYFE